LEIPAAGSVAWLTNYRNPPGARPSGFFILHFLLPSLDLTPRPRLAALSHGDIRARLPAFPGPLILIISTIFVSFRPRTILGRRTGISAPPGRSPGFSAANLDALEPGKFSAIGYGNVALSPIQLFGPVHLSGTVAAITAS